MKRPLLLLATALVLFATPLFAQQQPDGICTFDWHPHYEQLTRYVSGTGASANDAKTWLMRENPSISGLRETWYVARSSQGSETGAFNRLFNGSDNMDSPFTTEGGYPFNLALDFPWTSAAKANRTPAGAADAGMKPITRYLRPSPFDHQTWLNSQTPAGYNRDVVYDGAFGGQERYGYERFGNLLTKEDVLGTNGSGPAYGTYFLDNGILHVDYNKIWGNAVGRIAQVGTNRQIVLEPIGDMVQTVVRFFPDDPNHDDPDCRHPNPTQSGSIGPALSQTHLWTGSPVLSTTKTIDAVTAVQTLQSVVRPFEFLDTGASATARWPGTEDTSPLAWKGFIERTDNLGCRFGSITRKDVIKTTSRLILAANNGLTTQGVASLNTHWLRPADLADPATPMNWNFKIECYNFKTGVTRQLLAGKDLTYCANGDATCSDVTCGDPDGFKPPDDHAIIVTRADGSFGFAMVRFNLVLGESSNVVLRCGTVPCTTQDSGGIILQASRNSGTSRSILSKTAWSDPLESFLIVNNKNAILTRLGELANDDKSCSQ
jgi:hypothetical protein